MSCGVSFKVNPLKFIMASILDLGCRDIKNSYVTSSSRPWILSQKVIQLARVNRSTTSRFSRNFLESEGFFLINPPGMVRMLCFGLCSNQKWNYVYGFLPRTLKTVSLGCLYFTLHQFPGYNAIAAQNSTVKRELGSHTQSAELNFHPQPHKSNILYAQVSP